MFHEAVDLYGYPTRSGSLVITCEHASARVPRPLRVAPEDRRWLRTHWGLDIGARTVARELVRRTRSVGVMARFSRLVCDPNRPVDSPGWILGEVEGHRVSFNQEVDGAERLRRQTLYHDAYHAAVDRILGDRLRLGGDVLLLSVHSFTPEFGDQPREMEIGILFDRYRAVAQRLQLLLDGAGFRAALNAPYSGLGGMMFAANRHGRQHGVVYLEIEVRQDLITVPAKARALARRIAAALGELNIRTRRR